MFTDAIKLRLEEKVSEIIQREGCELYDLELAGTGRGRTLRIYIDKVSAPVSIDDCTRVSHGINSLLDTEDLVPGGSYQLEVSSPGIERFLKKPQHYLKAIGQELRIHTEKKLSDFGYEGALKNSKNFKAQLLSVEGENSVRIKLHDVEFNLPLKSIQKAHIVIDFDKDKQTHKKKR